MQPQQYLDLHNGGFPSHELALTDPDGLLAVGGDLSPTRLISAYRQGIFPWFNVGDPILWWCPAERAVFDPQTIHLSRSSRRLARKRQYRYSINQAFNEVMRGCAEPRASQAGTWICAPMQQAYWQLHQQGVAHSLEIWDGEELIGGLYGVAVGGVFCGESMFHRQTGASKLAIYLLGQHANQLGVRLIDAQIENPHLNSLGATVISRQQFLAQLHTLRDHDIVWPSLGIRRIDV
ncbi:leucyl/phenylalanyl-tRNA--protein transferase [Ferrimonas senticii]|uniref:leucyl/phenylalanyl-tRNA--protein transferase n=1 Tax=Ferrimonas senticii TaxID=394566 RepID=UPI003B838274